MTTSESMAVRSFLFRLASALAIVFFFAALARSGGPAYVAGPGYFNSSTMGQPITWSSGQLKLLHRSGRPQPHLAQRVGECFGRQRLQPVDFRLHCGPQGDRRGPARRRR